MSFSQCLRRSLTQDRRESVGVVCDRHAVGSQDAGARTGGLFAEERPLGPPPVVAAEGPKRHTSTNETTHSGRNSREEVRVGRPQRILEVVGAELRDDERGVARGRERLKRRRRPRRRERRHCGRRGDTPLCAAMRNAYSTFFFAAGGVGTPA